MKIGELARKSGFMIDTIRYYDKLGLVRPLGRSPTSRFREYGEEALEMLALVRAAKLAHLSRSQIRKILAAARNGSACRQVIPLLDSKVQEIDRAIRALRELRSRLTRALRRGFPKTRPAGCTCPILLGLHKAVAPPKGV